MSYNGSGTFQINTSGQPVVTGTSISSTVFNALTADLATGLSTAITKDGQTTTTARIPFALGINSTLVTDATNTTSGSIITAGGVGIAKALYVGTTANIAGVTTVQAGTAALPAITTTGDTNTGIFFPAADTIAFAEGGAEVARFDSSGNFGLGTASPNAKLEVYVTRTSSTNATAIVLSDNVTGNQTNGVYKSIQSISNGTSSKSEIRFIESDGTNNNTAIAFATQSTAGALTEKVRILNTGAIVCLSGGNTAATGTGIAFPATQSASSDANTLDDYEEGTWTPNQGGGLTVVGTFSSSGKYTKIGNMVFLQGYVSGSTSVALTNGTGISTNMPFTSTNTVVGLGALCNDNGTVGGTTNCGPNSTQISGSPAITATTIIYFSLTYQTA